ncbi:MAG: ribbon-helix-helix domain-containing protein [Candidatus Eremiobacteraeota bacterium]|nr:ribbon-helix-helix domain-containing protein [Candidatus Eremiobacteraeota bacterium]
MSLSEKRTQIYLPLETFQQVKRIALLKNVSIASIIRGALDEYLETEKEETKYNIDSIEGLVGIFEGEEDLSLNHDRYLYE